MDNNRIFVVIAIALLLAFSGRHTATAQQAKAPPKTNAGKPSSNRNNNKSNNNDISINFDNAPILKVIDVMSQVTGKNFIIDPAVKGNVTVIAPARVPKEEAYGVFESILELNGFSLVQLGDIIKVVPSRSAMQKSIPVVPGGDSAKIRERDQIVTQLIPVKYSNAQEIMTILTPLVSRDANLTVYANTNTIILTEVSSNIKRLLRILEEIDVPGFEETISIIPLVNAQADILAQEILQALEPGPAVARGAPAPRTRRRAPVKPAVTGTTTAQIKIIPDLRTNSLIVVANEPDTEQVRFLVHELDQVTPIEANNIHVYRLQNALAEEIAAVLTSLAATTTPAAAPGTGAAAVGGVRTFYKEVSVVADKTTNSLIITATPQDYAVLSRVIEQLDIMRPQVLVEALIAEVSLDFTRNLGIRWQAASKGGDPVFGTVKTVGTGGSLVDNITTPETLPEGLPAFDNLDNIGNILPALTPGGLTLGYLNIDSGFLRGFIELNASEGNSDFNVLSAPHILTLDNEQATINISDNVPFITQRVGDNVSGVGTITTNETFEYRDVGIILEITPHISPDRMVRLEIVQKVNDVSEVQRTGSTAQLSEKKREAETTVMVMDRHTLVLGGLMKDTDDVTVNKVPFLGDIPFLGWAFKSKSTKRKKTNLLIFITPNIVATVAEAADLTIEKRGDAGEALLEQMECSPTMRRSKTFNESAGFVDDALIEAGPK